MAKPHTDAESYALTVSHEIGHGTLELFLDRRFNEANIPFNPFYNQTHPLLDEGAMEVLKAIVTASNYYDPAYNYHNPQSLVREIVGGNTNFYYFFINPFYMSILPSLEYLSSRPVTTDTVWVYGKILKWADGGLVTPDDFNKIVDL